MSSDPGELARRAHDEGWAGGTGTVEEVEVRARALGWRAVRMRRQDPVRAVLVPRTREQAPRRSLSAHYGLDAQPLHTDGAHLHRPPDVVVLVAHQSSRTPTHLWGFQRHGATLPRHALASGMFLVDTGPIRFLATAQYDGGLRYDPGCMTPGDQRARELASYIERQWQFSEQHHWTREHQVLLIDNRHALHARGAVADDAARVLYRLAFHLPEKP